MLAIRVATRTETDEAAWVDVTGMEEMAAAHGVRMTTTRV
jgi:hypothetical protein